MHIRTITIVLGLFFPLLLPPVARAETPTERSVEALADKYAGEYCGLYTMNAPPSLEGTAAYGAVFFERLSETRDRDLSIACARYWLSSKIGSALSDFEKGLIQVGMMKPRKMKKEERASCEASIREMMQDLTVLDPKDSQKSIAEFRARLEAAVKIRK